MRRLLLACAATLTLGAMAHAKTFDLPTATVTIPDDWKPSEIDKGVEANSPDSETYFTLEAATAKDSNALIEDDIKFLADQGVVIDPATQSKQEGSINGLPAAVISWDGKDKNGPATVTLAIVAANPSTMLLITSWSSPDGDKANGPALTKIMQSIRGK